MPHPDHQLVQDSLAGDSSAFGTLYDRYATRIYQYHYYRTFHRETAEDLTSLTFIRALEKLSSYDVNKGTFSAWIYRLARNLLVDHVRAIRPTIDLEDVSEVLRDQRNLLKTIEEQQELERVQRHLNTLTPEQREIVLLRLWDELPYADIARLMGKSEAACKMTMSRVLADMRTSLPVALLLLILLHSGHSSLYVPHS